jgi:acetaldehyde dehydrogenase (acetylating)
MTLGCGAAGGNITSDNISPLHLINLRRIAYEARPVTHGASLHAPVASAAETSTATCGACATSAAPTSAPAAGIGVNWSVARAVDRFLAGKHAEPPTAKPATTLPQAAPAKADVPPPPKPRAVDFVSEAEIRAAVKRKVKIFIGPKTIITPAARDLAAEYDVLVRVD